MRSSVLGAASAKVKFAGMAARAVFRNGHVFGMTTECTVVVSEHSVADLEGCHGAPTSSTSGELIAEDCQPWPDNASKESHDKWLCSPETTICPIHRGRMNLDEHLVVSDRRLFHVGDPNHIRRAVPRVDCCLHRWTVAKHVIKLLTCDDAVG